MEEGLNEILNALENCYDFDELSEATYYNDLIYDFKQKYKKPFDWDHGASKLVLLFPNLDFVIKIPFKGEYNGCWDEEEEGEPEPDDYEDFCSFCGASGSESWDYCLAETENYDSAIEYEVQNCFAKTEKVATIHGYPIYKQERVDKVFDFSTSTHSEEDSKKIQDFCATNCYSCFNVDWLCDALAFFGQKVFDKLMEFISFMEINDLHSGNLGYVAGRPVIFDYSGWND